MNRLRYLSIEIGPRCNLCAIHDWCPAHVLSREKETMSVDTIVGVIRSALDMGFSGHVAFHFYNEPLLYTDRINAVMDAVPEAKYLLWTNGTLEAQESTTAKRFDKVVSTDYYGGGNYQYLPDDRMNNYGEPLRNSVKCKRPLVELPIDYSGEVHLCCQDWKNTVEFGNVTEEPFKDIALRWLRYTDLIVNGMGGAPVCRSCLGVQPC